MCIYIYVYNEEGRKQEGKQARVWNVEGGGGREKEKDRARDRDRERERERCTHTHTDKEKHIETRKSTPGAGGGED